MSVWVVFLYKLVYWNKPTHRKKKKVNLLEQTKEIIQKLVGNENTIDKELSSRADAIS